MLRITQAAVSKSAKGTPESESPTVASIWQRPADGQRH
jgi:hypothetical protein